MDNSKQHEKIHSLMPEFSKIAGIHEFDLRQHCNRRVVCEVRGIIWMLLYKYFKKSHEVSYAIIGEYFCGRDHATIIHGINRTKELLALRKADGKFAYPHLRKLKNKMEKLFKK